MSQRLRLLLMLVLFLPLLGLAAFALRARSSGAWVILAAQPAEKRPATASVMAGMLPPGALLTIEAPDFAGLLHSWSGSPEASAWMRSANYSFFANSRLFGRLSAAQDEFASAAKLSDAGTSLLDQVAGGQSVFAWYDIGELQFLYITRMPASRAQQSALFAQRPSFHRRQVGSSVFYVRTETVPGSSRQRTVAFASVGDLLLLSTREDLMAGALTLIGAPVGESVAKEPWYVDALTAHPAGPRPADLHMVLNLERIVPTPYFRSYWIQGNVSEFKTYRSAVSDLYRESVAGESRFREERTVLMKQEAATSEADPDLGALAALVPPGTGVFRAQATTDSAGAIALLNEKLLTHQTDTSTRQTSAPDPDATASLAGNSSDLETRIDTPAPVPASAATEALGHLLDAAGLQATLSLGTTSASSGLFLSIHSAVVMRTSRRLDQSALADALQQALRGNLTASNLGIEFRPVSANPAIFELSGPKPLFVAQSSARAGELTLLSDDEPTLQATLARVDAAAPSVQAIFLAGFDHTVERQPFSRLTGLIDGPAEEPVTENPTPSVPAFFSGNIRSLSDTFSRLASEQVLVRHEGSHLHQTVIYRWQP